MGTGKVTRQLAAVGVIIGSVGALSGCTGRSSPPAAETHPTDAPVCGANLYALEISQAAQSLPESTDWNAGYAAEGSGNFDPCAVLSGAVAIPQGASSYAPVHILLFHYGQFVGTATKIPYRDAGIDVAKSTDDTVVVSYHWPLGDECHACYRGVGDVRFAWDGNEVSQLDQIPAEAQAAPS